MNSTSYCRNRRNKYRNRESLAQEVLGGGGRGSGKETVLKKTHEFWQCLFLVELIRYVFPGAEELL